MESYSELTITPQEDSVLSDELQQMQQHVEASTGQRFVNFLVDNLLMQYGISYVTGTLVGFFTWLIIS